MMFNRKNGFSVAIIMLLIALIGFVVFLSLRIISHNKNPDISENMTESQKNSEVYDYAQKICQAKQEAAGVRSTYEECVNYQINSKRGIAINNLYSLLEQYRILNNGYPSEVRINVLYPDGIVNVARSSEFKDPFGNEIVNKPAVSTLAEAREIAVPNSNNNFMYVPYGDPSCETNCKGFVLVSYMDLPSPVFKNLYIKESLSPQ